MDSWGVSFLLPCDLWHREPVFRSLGVVYFSIKIHLVTWFPDSSEVYEGLFPLPQNFSCIDRMICLRSCFPIPRLVKDHTASCAWILQLGPTNCERPRENMSLSWNLQSPLKALWLCFVANFNHRQNPFGELPCNPRPCLFHPQKTFNVLARSARTPQFPHDSPSLACRSEKCRLRFALQLDESLRTSLDLLVFVDKASILRALQRLRFLLGQPWRRKEGVLLILIMYDPICDTDQTGWWSPVDMECKQWYIDIGWPRCCSPLLFQQHLSHQIASNFWTALPCFGPIFRWSPPTNAMTSEFTGWFFSAGPFSKPQSNSRTWRHLVKKELSPVRSCWDMICFCYSFFDGFGVLSGCTLSLEIVVYSRVLAFREKGSVSERLANTSLISPSIFLRDASPWETLLFEY